jgi:WD40 repeat protein
MWDLESGTVVKRFMGHTDTVGGLAVSEDGNSLVTGSDDYTVRLWDVRGEEKPAKPLKTFTGHEVGIWSVSLSADGRRALSGDGGGAVFVWNLTTRDSTNLPPHKFDVLGVAVSRDGKWGATGAVGKFLRLWDLDKGQQAGQVTLSTGVGAVAFSPDGRWLAAASGWLKTRDGSLTPAVKSGDNRIRLYSVPDLKLAAESQDFSEPLNSLHFSRDGHFIVAGGPVVYLFEVKVEDAPPAKS